MKSTLSSVALITALSVGASASVDAETWGLDPSHTEVSITWNHAGFSMQSASFTEFSGTLELDPENVGALSADFSVAVASVRTAFEPFTGHLQSADFFDAETYPDIRFVSTSAEQTGDMTATVTGDMTIKGTTAPVTFDVTVHALGEHPVGQFFEAYQGTWLGFTATAQIKRSDFGVDNFIPIGSDEVTIEINSEMRQGGFGG